MLSQQQNKHKKYEKEIHKIRVGRLVLLFFLFFTFSHFSSMKISLCFHVVVFLFFFKDISYSLKQPGTRAQIFFCAMKIHINCLEILHYRSRSVQSSDFRKKTHYALGISIKPFNNLFSILWCYSPKLTKCIVLINRVFMDQGVPCVFH